MPETKNVTATILRRQLRPALKTVESGGRIVITRHNKVVAALVSAADLERLQGGSAVIVTPPAPTEKVVVTSDPVVKAVAALYEVATPVAPAKLLTDL